MNKTLLTAESVCAGHPDKLCDYIADTILDACLSADKSARCACEVMATGHNIIVAGEITCKKRLDIRNIVRRCLTFIGYNPFEFKVSVLIHPQSKEISGAVDSSYEERTLAVVNDSFEGQGAGDQGTMYGYACTDTKEMMPIPIILAHTICRELDYQRKNGLIKGIKPDGKAQVSVFYDENGKPTSIYNIVISIQHDADKNIYELEEEIKDKILIPFVYSILPSNDYESNLLINPSGRFVIGGPAGDTGLTGRKLMVDTYGGNALHGGGAFSGKDPSKVDRSGAYMARYIAKNVVAAGIAKKVQIGISYAIGKAHPVAVSVDTFGTSTISEEQLSSLIMDSFDMRPAAIIKNLNLLNTKYYKYSMYGHFGRKEAPWEATDKAEELRKAVMSEYGSK